MKNKKLHNIKKAGFKTPDSYFQSLQNRIFDKLTDENILENIQETGYGTPDTYFESIEDQVLNKINNDVNLSVITKSGFKAPNNYFESVEDKVLNTLKKDETTKVFPLLSRQNVLYISSIAAIVMIMFGLLYDKTDNEFDSLELEVVETYLEEQNLDMYDLASLLTEEDLSQDDFGIINDNFSEESLEDYLIDNANLEDIIEQ